MSREKRSENLYESKRKSFLRNDNANANACPFKLRWSFGINLDVPVLNLTTEDRTLIAYASSHAVILYDYEAREILPLQGHQNAVRALSTDRRGKWLLSADFENDCVVVVWDTEIRTPICTLFNPHGSDGLSAVRLSPDAKYIATVGNEKHQKLSVWLWTYGRDKPDASIELADTRADRVKKIAFNAEFPEQLILLLDDSVIFVTWTRDTLRTHRGDVVGKSRRRYGALNDSSYISKTHLVLTGSSNGFVLVWSDVVYSESFDVKRRTSNRKKHVKSVRLQDAAITNVVDHEGIVVIGNAAGEIHFYDHQLRLLYWCRDIGLESIRSISFNLASNLGRPRSTVSESDAPESTSEEDSAEETRKREDEEVDSERSDGDYRREGIIGRQQERIPSNVTIDIDFPSKVGSYEESKISMPRAPDVDPPARLLFSDATLLRAPFVVRPFIALTSKGRVARVDIPKLKCRFLLRTSEAPITALDAHPDRDHLVTGNKLGDLCLYEYTLPSRMVTKKTPPLPPFASIVDQELEKGELVYATSPRHHESMKAVTALKYSPNGDMLACGLESGAIWILHPDTLDPMDKIPFKHSSGSILSIAFSESTDYMAYSDDAFTVAVFRRNVTASCVLEEEKNDDPIWKFLGKCHSHFMPVRTVLFGPPASLCTIPRFFSIAEDRHLVEYDLENSGPYPEPGLKVLRNHTIERTAIPLCLDWYPDFKSEKFLVTSNSEYKFKLLNDITKTTRGTVLGPTFGAPVQRMKVLPFLRNSHNQAYMIFVTDKEIGLQLLPFDGNPYKIVGMIGHPVKLANLAVSACGKFLFTIGSFDPCVLMWKINVRVVDATARLGGDSLLPFYRLVDGGRNGWLINEMRDLFYYAQILQQGESSLATRVVSDKVSAKQLPNLMRAVGFYPSNYELENLMSEVAYRDYADTGRQIEDVSFEDLVRLYVNHRPAFGISLRELSKAFRIFARSSDNPLLPATSREDFIDILLGKGKLTTGSVRQPALQNLYGDPLTLEEARTFLKLLMPNPDAKDDATSDEAIESNLHFDFLPAEISYKDFVTDVMGIELPEETQR